ncbi:hypothetical protein [Chryseobacterium sp. R2ACT005]|uniref:hypothetical protein n=1 Tax=Chryseobacterium sp. R2ACT005 TaxID=3416668 RepID=UPI003CEFF449
MIAVSCACLAARVCLELAIEKCAEEAKDEETENWLKYGRKVESGIDVQIIGGLTDLDFSSLLDNKEESDDALTSNEDKELNKYEVAIIKGRIEHTENPSKINSIICVKYSCVQIRIKSNLNYY